MLDKLYALSTPTQCWGYFTTLEKAMEHVYLSQVYQVWRGYTTQLTKIVWVNENNRHWNGYANRDAFKGFHEKGGLPKWEIRLVEPDEMPPCADELRSFAEYKLLSQDEIFSIMDYERVQSLRGNMLDAFNYTWIEHGKILAGSIPWKPEHLDELHGMGIRAILTLTRRDIRQYPGITIRLHVVYSDIAHLHVGIPDGGIPDNDRLTAKAIDFIDSVYQSGKPVFIHCAGGIGRTGIILEAYYVLRRGLSLAEAQGLVRQRKNYANIPAGGVCSPQLEWSAALESKRGQL